MLSAITNRKFCVLNLLALLTACGGGSGGSPEAAPPPVPPPPPPPVLTSPAAATTLSVSLSVLALKVSGASRSVSVVNTGAHPATLVEVDPAVVFPAGTTYLNHCATLAPGATCTITITPGAVASAPPGALAPVPVSMAVRGSNTNTPTVQVHVLDYGSVYQGGHVFALDDATPPSASIGGKVAIAGDSTALYNWSQHNVAPGAVFEIPGVTDNSAGPLPFCNGKFDGACNTQRIVSAPEHVGVPLTGYAAGACRATINGYADWYLPAICELSDSASTGCTSGESVQERLHRPGHVSFPTSWSSTQWSVGPVALAWFHAFAPPGGGSAGMFKGVPTAVSCVRQLTH